MERSLKCLVAAVFAALASCASDRVEVQDLGWEMDVRREVRRSGAQNWIVIADAAFPVLGRKGVRTLVGDQTSIDVLDLVLDEMSQTEHVQPQFYLANELDQVDDDSVKVFEKQVTRSLAGRQMIRVQQRTLMTLIGDDKPNYQVLVIKTTTSLPYSALFIELDSGYWESGLESDLRSRMGQ